MLRKAKEKQWNDKCQIKLGKRKKIHKQKINNKNYKTKACRNERHEFDLKKNLNYDGYKK